MMAKRMWSAFTDDMNHCFFTHDGTVERHHIYGGSRKKQSEKYGYIVPLRPDLHPNGVYAGKDAKRIDSYLKEMAQRDFEEHYGSRMDFIKIFGKSYL